MSNTLEEIIAETQAKFKTEPNAAKAQFHSSSRLEEGLCTKAVIRHHEITVDEPEALGGTDHGPNPVEIVLAALGTCQEITYMAFAKAMGIPLKGVSVEVTGDIDLKGFFAVDESVRPGFEKINATVTLISDASEEDINRLKQVVDSHCPVLDIIKNPVPVTLALKQIRHEMA